MVADMMMIFKSGRMISCACRVRASARSELMLLYLAVVSGYLVLAKWNQIREKIYKIRQSHALPF